jgi:hypothetical protein
VDAYRLKAPPRGHESQPLPAGFARALGPFFDAVQRLAEMPPVHITADSIPHEQAHRSEAVGPALRWLSEFVKRWEDRRRSKEGA